MQRTNINTRVAFQAWFDSEGGKLSTAAAYISSTTQSDRYENLLVLPLTAAPSNLYTVFRLCHNGTARLWRSHVPRLLQVR
jgi:hypothetical protein